jgi:Trafficking protein particle complex subunit 10, TRAPPC10
MAGAQITGGCPCKERECRAAWCTFLLPDKRSQIVATASINILSTTFSAKHDREEAVSLYAGQPINAELVIQTSFRWGAEEDTRGRYVLNYHVEDMTREWLIGGLKQGDFIAEVSFYRSCETEPTNELK